MVNNDKRDLIINTAKEMMKTTDIQSISVNSIAKSAGIGKGSIYYYFKSKEDIIDAVFESSYSTLIENGNKLLENRNINAFEKLKIMYQACVSAAMALVLQTNDRSSFKEKQYISYYHQQFTDTVVRKCQPFLSEILKQGINEGLLQCDDTDVMAELILTTLTVIIDNQYASVDEAGIIKRLKMFATMQEKTMNTKEGAMSFLYQDNPPSK